MGHVRRKSILITEGTAKEQRKTGKERPKMIYNIKRKECKGNKERAWIRTCQTAEHCTCIRATCAAYSHNLFIIINGFMRMCAKYLKMFVSYFMNIFRRMVESVGITYER